MRNKSEPLAPDSRVKSPIFWSIVQITKGTRPQRKPLRLPEGGCHPRLCHIQALHSQVWHGLSFLPKRDWLTWFQAPGSRKYASTAPFITWKNASMLLSIWSASRCWRSWKENIQLKASHHPDYFSNKSRKDSGIELRVFWGLHRVLCLA